MNAATAKSKTKARKGGDPILAYHLLRVASETFGVPPYEMTAEQRREAEKKAADAVALQRMALDSPEGRGATVPDAVVDGALAEIAARYDNAKAFEGDLARCGLSAAGLRDALARDLAFDALMDRVADSAPEVTDEEVAAFYDANAAKFAAPETREASQILITVNEEFAENTREQARRRIDEIGFRITVNPRVFNAEAARFSECPSALQDGHLGRIKRGMLFPALDRALFGLCEGDVSGVLESEIGFHLLRCDKVYPASVMPRQEAEARIRAGMIERRRQGAQRAWLAAVKKEAIA